MNYKKFIPDLLGMCLTILLFLYTIENYSKTISSIGLHYRALVEYAVTKHPATDLTLMMNFQMCVVQLSTEISETVILLLVIFYLKSITKLFLLGTTKVI